MPELVLQPHQVAGSYVAAPTFEPALQERESDPALEDGEDVMEAESDALLDVVRPAVSVALSVLPELESL